MEFSWGRGWSSDWMQWVHPCPQTVSVGRIEPSWRGLVFAFRTLVLVPDGATPKVWAARAICHRPASWWGKMLKVAPNPPQAYINIPALPSPVLNPVPPHFPLIPPAFCFAPSPPQALPLYANNPVANNVNPLPPFCACTIHFLRKRFFTTINLSTAPTKEVSPLKFCPHKPRSSCAPGFKSTAFSGSSPV